jgi:CRP/FNR family transcriptional activator FtrB
VYDACLTPQRFHEKGHGVMAKHKIDADLLRASPLFNHLSDPHLQEIAKSASLREVAARTIIFSEGDRPCNLYTVIRGFVELYSEHDDRCFTIAVVRAGGTLALSSILTDRNPLSARILEPSELLVVPVELVSKYFAQEPAFAFALMHGLASEYQAIIEDFKNHRLRSTTERVAHWMLRCDGINGLTGRFVIPFDKRVLASYLGMAPEHLSRSFTTLASAGVVVHGRSITLTDRAALTMIAGLSGPDET